MVSSAATRGFPNSKHFIASILLFVILSTDLAALEEMSSELISGFDEQVVQPGSDVTVKCVAEGNLRPTITWYLDDQPLQQSNRIRISNKAIDDNHWSSQLAISQISLIDGGLYTCAKNNNSRVNGFAARINVFGPIGIRQMMELTVVSGETFTTSCPYNGYPISEVIWKKGDMLLPRHVLQTVKNGVLTIDKVKKETDSGQYECVVIDKNGHQVEGQFNLNVMIPAKVMPFFFQEDLLREGMRARFQCVVSEGDSPIKIQWTKDNKAISDDDGVIIRSLDEFTSILTINHVGPRHNGRYTCTASNPVSRVSHTARLNVNVSPKIIPFSFQNKYLSEGTQARVLCGLSQGDSPIRFQWLKESIPIEDRSVLIRNIDNYSSILSIAFVSGQHSGNYTCVANNSVGSATYTTDLIVNVPPKIVPFSFQEHHLLEGMLVRVSCVVSRGDLPLSITWLKDGQPIPAHLSVTTRDFDEYSSVLSIDPVRVKHNGNYTCVAQNAAAAVNYSAQLLVTELPKWIVKPNDASVHLGSPHLAHCEASGFPKPLITWLKVKGPRPSGDRERISSGPNFELLANGSLLIPSVKQIHQGFYFCVANNSIGTASEMIQLNIKAPPEIVTKTSSYISRKGASLTLKCVGRGDKPMAVVWSTKGQNLSSTASSRYQTKYYDANGTTIFELKIPVAERKDSTVFKCLVTNAYGRDDATFNVTVQDSPDPPMKLQVLEVMNRTAVVGWAAPFNGHSPIIKYIIQIKQADGKWDSSTRNQTTPGQTLQAAITGLKPSMQYHVRVLAENAIGISQPSETREVTMAQAAPSSSPQGVVVIATDSNSLKASWKPPAKEDWNGGIRGYYVGHKVSGSLEPYQFRLLEVPEDYDDTLSLPITNLQKFTQYSVVIQAFNDGGKGPLSNEVLALTSESVPTKPPTDVRCSVLTSQAIHVTWHQPPVNSIHGILQGYKITYRPVQDKTEVRPLTKTANTTKLTLHNLEKFTNYSLQVLAFTRRGDGIKSTPVFCKTLEDIPDMPSDINALSASSDTVIVVWKAPQHSNGVIVKYTVYSMRSNKKGAPKQSSVHGNLTYYEIHGLNLKEEQYELWVTASTSVGESQKSRIITTTSIQDTIPGKIAAFNDEILINQGEDIQLHCRAVGKPFPEQSWTSENNLSLFCGRKLDENERVQFLTDGSLIIKDVQETDNGNYTCRVQNMYGKDQVTYSLVVQAVPGIMYVEVSLISTTSIDIQWKMGTSGGSPINGFKLSYKIDEGDWSTADLEPTMTSYRLDGLHCGTKYHLKMAAYNKLGEGKSCAVITTSTKGGVPVPPTKDALVEESSTFISLNLNSWTIDKCPVKYFVVEYKAFSRSDWIFFSDDIQPEKRKILITDLVPATWYNLRMIAHSSAGASVAEYAFATLTPEGGTVLPETVSDEGAARPIAFQLDIKHLIAAAAAVLIILLLGIIICICSRKSPSKRHKSKRGQSMFKGGPSECGSDSTYNTSYGYASGRGNIGTDPRRLHSLGRNGDLSPYATAQIADHYPSHEMTTVDLRNCVVGIGNHLPPGITIPFYPQGGVRPVSGNPGNIVSPMNSELMNFHGQMPQFPMAPVMTIQGNGDAVCQGNEGRNVPPTPVAPSLPSAIQSGLQRSSGGEIETTFVFPSAPQVSSPRAGNQGEQKYDAPWERNLASAAMKEL